MREEQRVYELLATRLYDRLDTLPHKEKLATGLEEKLFVEQPVVKERAGVLPIAQYLHRQRAIFRAGRSDAHGVLEGIHDVVLCEPVACLAQPCLAPQIVYLQVKLSLLVRGFRCHVSFSPFIFIVFLNPLHRLTEVAATASCT